MTTFTRRPLPREMQLYAQMDTHYLLYCRDRLHNELLEKEKADTHLLRDVLYTSRDVCRRVYQKPRTPFNAYSAVEQVTREIILVAISYNYA